MNYARGISAARVRKGLSKRRLASLIGVDASYVTHLEAGKKTPSLATVETIARVLDIPVYLLMLLSSDEADLRGVTVTNAETLGLALLDLLSPTTTEREDADPDA